MEMLAEGIACTTATLAVACGMQAVKRKLLSLAKQGRTAREG